MDGGSPSRRVAYQEPILLAAALSLTMCTTLMQQATTPAALLLAAKAIAVGIEPTSEQLLTIAQRLFDLNDPTIPPTKSDGIKPVLGDASRIQREYDSQPGGSDSHSPSFRPRFSCGGPRTCHRSRGGPRTAPHPRDIRGGRPLPTRNTAADRGRG